MLKLKQILVATLAATFLAGAALAKIDVYAPTA